MLSYRIKPFVTAGILSLFAASPIFAFVSTPFGWYLEANVGATKITDDDIAGTGSASASGLGGSAAVGYKFMPYFAGEAGFTRYTNTDIEAASGTGAATVKRYSYYLAAKGILPVYDTGAEFFGKLGVQRLRARTSIDNEAAAASIGVTNSSHSKTGVYVGLGGQYYFMPEFALVLQWARAQGSESTGTADLFSIGASFIFD